VSDLYELVLAMDIRTDLTEDELAELRWHVGQGPRPEQLPSGADSYLATYPLGDPEDPDCEWETEEPRPAFAQRGAAIRVGGALVAELVARNDPEGWALTVRQELHPDDFYRLRTLLDWLGPHSVHAGTGGAETGGIAFVVGHLRFEENHDSEPFLLVNGQIRVPGGIDSHTPLWQRS
jgi:hypothetical protein